MTTDQLTQGQTFLEAELKSVLKDGYTVRSGVDSESPYFTIDSANRKSQLIVRLSREVVEDCNDRAMPSSRKQWSTYIKEQGRYANELKDGQD